MKNRKKVRVEPIIDGYSRFLFLDKKDMPEVALHWEKHFQWALGKYNRTHEEMCIRDSDTPPCLVYSSLS